MRIEKLPHPYQNVRQMEKVMSQVEYEMKLQYFLIRILAYWVNLEYSLGSKRNDKAFCGYDGG